MKATDGTPLTPTQLRALEAYSNQLRLMNYSPNTIRTYASWFSVFLANFPDHKPSRISRQEVMQFLLTIRNRKR
jgi:hypothetical protein